MSADLEVVDPRELGIPVFVECPCGDGRAEVLNLAQASPFRSFPGRPPYCSTGDRMLIWNYVHEGCDIGGSIVVVGERIVRRVGPLFSGEAFSPGVESIEPVAAPAPATPAKGGAD